MKPRLQVAAGPLADSVYFLTEAEVRIGRDPSNSLTISDLSLSRRHCVLTREDDGYQLRDLESRNGTFVNGGVVSEKRLNHGDQISVGESVFVFLTKEDSDGATTEAIEFDDCLTQAELLPAPIAPLGAVSPVAPQPGIAAAGAEPLPAT